MLYTPLRTTKVDLLTQRKHEDEEVFFSSARLLVSVSGCLRMYAKLKSLNLNFFFSLSCWTPEERRLL